MDPHVDRASASHVLTLYVAGASSRSAEAIEELRRLCEAEPAGTFDLRVVDVNTRPDLAVLDDVVATPTLVKHIPYPVQRFVGKMLTDRLIVAIDAAPEPPPDGLP